MRFRKDVFSFTVDGVTIRIKCYHNNISDLISIQTIIAKSVGNANKSHTNRMCPSFLGCHVAESILSKLFNDVELMPYRNPGYDFKCANDYLVDVKAATMGKQCGNWAFRIHKNGVPDYFLCIAFDNRIDLLPVHVWLVPGKVINQLETTSISTKTIDRWIDYELIEELDVIKQYCNERRKK